MVGRGGEGRKMESTESKQVATTTTTAVAGALEQGDLWDKRKE